MLNDLFGSNAFRLRMEIREDAMAEHRDSQLLNVLDGDVIPALHQGAGLRTENQELRSAQAGAVVHVLLDEVRSILADGRLVRASWTA